MSEGSTIDVGLVTYKHFSTSWEKETPHLQKQLNKLGLSAEIISWDKKVDWKKFNVLVIRSTWDYHLHCDAFLQWVQNVAKVSKIYNSQDVIIWNSEKSYLLELEKKGTPIIPTRVLRKEHDIKKEIIALLETYGTIVIKPVIGASSNLTKRFTKNETENAILLVKEIITKFSGAIIQPYCKEIEDGERSMVFIDKMYSHAVKKVPKKGDFRVQYQYGGRNSLFEPSEEEKKFALKILDTVKYDLLYTRVDYLVRDGKCYLMELELIEPSLYVNMYPQVNQTLANAIAKRLK